MLETQQTTRTNMSSSFFHRTPKVPKTVTECTQSHMDTSRLTSEDPDVAAFYAQLNPRERIAHTIAIDKLGTSYDVTRTHAFVKWMKNREGNHTSV
jgi:hypothetical protein